jgi:predicted DNA-binding transcriptional regulator YafY
MLLDSRGTVKACELSKILETSERTIYRDIDLLCESGIPITSSSGPTGGYSFMEGFKVNTPSLGGRDVFNLVLLSMGLPPEKGSESSIELKNALLKLEKSVAKEYHPEIVRAKEKFFIDVDPWWGPKPVNKHIDLLKKAVLDLTKLHIAYKKYTGELSSRIVHPYGVVVKNGEWYLIAFCNDKQDIRVFKCSRLEQVVVLEETFTMPKDFCLETFWADSKTHFVKKAAAQNTPASYVVTLASTSPLENPFKGFDLLSEIYTPCQKQPPSQDFWLYEIDFLSFQTACSLLFPVSDVVKVVSPCELKDFIVKKAKNISSIYKNSLF